MQGLAFDVLHRDEEKALELAGIVNGDDVGMLQHARQPSLIAKALQKLFGVGAVHVEPRSLEGDGASDVGIGGLVNHSHGAFAQGAYDFIAPDFGQRHFASRAAQLNGARLAPANG